MDKFFNEVSTPNWWISVVIVGLLINVASSFIYKWYERYSAKYSDKKRKELEEKEKYRQDRISGLMGKKEAQIFQYLKISHYKQSALEKYLLSVILINVPFTISAMFPFYFMSEGIVGTVINLIFASFAFTNVRLGLKMSADAKFENDVLENAMQQEQPETANQGERSDIVLNGQVAGDRQHVPQGGEQPNQMSV